MSSLIKMKYLSAIAAMSAMAFAATSDAAVVTLQFQTDGAQGAAFDFDANTGSYNGPNYSLLFEAYVGGVLGDAGDQLNATGSSFGINESTAGDETSQIDFDNGQQEAIRITFTPIGPTTITLTSFDIGLFGGTDAGTFSIISESSTAILGGTQAVNMDVTGKTIEFLYTTAGGTGFSLDQMTFDAVTVPEPSSMVLLGCGLASVCFVRRRNRRMTA